MPFFVHVCDYDAVCRVACGIGVLFRCLHFVVLIDVAAVPSQNETLQKHSIRSISRPFATGKHSGSKCEIEWVASRVDTKSKFSIVDVSIVTINTDAMQ